MLCLLHLIYISLYIKEYDHIIAEVRGKVGLITLNRPKALNALCTPLLADITHACKSFDANDDVGAIVITGSEKAFAAGADIKEMAEKNFVDCYVNNMFADWTEVTKIVKPVCILLIRLPRVILFYPDHCSCVWICVGWWL